VIGPQVQELRARKGWSQSRFAAKLQIYGWELSRESISKLENQLRRVPDLELFVIAKVFGVKADDMLGKGLVSKVKQLARSYHPKLSRGQIPF